MTAGARNSAGGRRESFPAETCYPVRSLLFAPVGRLPVKERNPAATRGTSHVINDPRAYAAVVGGAGPPQGPRLGQGAS